MTDVRNRLMTLADDRGASLAALSRMLGANAAYLQQYVRRGTPRILPDRHRATLAAFFGVGEEEFGGAKVPAAMLLPRLDLFASAGPGALVDGETLIGTEAIDPTLARTLDLKPGMAAIVRVRGDSMEPGLLDGDHIVVDRADTLPGPRGAVYVIRQGDVMMVKRVARSARGLTVTSDNPAAAAIPDEPVVVIGRVVWQMRRWR
ncbi:S24 family peptidase [Sphingomonas sp. Leaf343]|uniref:S24 family peptidase n=1 Tax=Sphingomonas sp. Leaf343 TaxID=1736345 RepID=UPI0006FF89D6|nr:S24 family peptidase [Sphingomonas sp. Leaf343]KQR83315.1 peptidase S24 [Sphingomonas sp. Leaf343]